MTSIAWRLVLTGELIEVAEMNTFQCTRPVIPVAFRNSRGIANWSVPEFVAAEPKVWKVPFCFLLLGRGAKEEYREGQK